MDDELYSYIDKQCAKAELVGALKYCEALSSFLEERMKLFEEAIAEMEREEE